MFKLSIITPNGKVFEDNVDALNAPGLLGRFEILSGHMPIVAAIKQGQAKITANDKQTLLTFGNGVIEVDTKHDVIVLTDQAEEIK